MCTGSHSKTESKSNEVVQTYVPFALQLGGLQKELNAKLRELIVDPLTDLVNVSTIFKPPPFLSLFLSFFLSFLCLFFAGSRDCPYFETIPICLVTGDQPKI